MRPVTVNGAHNIAADRGGGFFAGGGGGATKRTVGAKALHQGPGPLSARGLTGARSTPLGGTSARGGMAPRPRKLSSAGGL